MTNDEFSTWTRLGKNRMTEKDMCIFYICEFEKPFLRNPLGYSCKKKHMTGNKEICEKTIARIITRSAYVYIVYGIVCVCSISLASVGKIFRVLYRPHHLIELLLD